MMVNCANCHAIINDEGTLYDYREELYYCDEACFYEWADSNADKMADYYFDRVIE